MNIDDVFCNKILSYEENVKGFYVKQKLKTRTVDFLNRRKVSCKSKIILKNTYQVIVYDSSFILSLSLSA